MTAPRVRQSGRSQFADALVILVLLFVTMFVTTWIVESTADDGGAGVTNGKSIEQLPISPAEREQYQSMVDEGMVDEETAGQQVADNAPASDKYPINPWVLLGTALLLVGYLGFVYRMSFKEYRDVIEEKFGRKDVQS
ncbi:MAG: hypothetical protein GEV10_26685 [Streptosporangiales bacterium]|nr:hypothetical protein [Streptosporangiales bacterium]